MSSPRIAAVTVARPPARDPHTALTAPGYVLLHSSFPVYEDEIKNLKIEINSYNYEWKFATGDEIPGPVIIVVALP